MTEKFAFETKFRFLEDFCEKPERKLPHHRLMEMSLGELLYFVLMGEGESQMQGARG